MPDRHPGIIALAICVSLAGCDGPLSLLTGGGPNVAANTQAGRTNVQAVGATEITDQRIVRPQARKIEQRADRNKVSAGKVESVIVHEAPAWLIIAFAVALFMDSPLRWPGQILGVVRRKVRPNPGPRALR